MIPFFFVSYTKQHQFFSWCRYKKVLVQLNLALFQYLLERQTHRCSWSCAFLLLGSGAFGETVALGSLATGFSLVFVTGSGDSMSAPIMPRPGGTYSFFFLALSGWVSTFQVSYRYALKESAHCDLTKDSDVDALYCGSLFRTCFLSNSHTPDTSNPDLTFADVLYPIESRHCQSRVGKAVLERRTALHLSLSGLKYATSKGWQKYKFNIVLLTFNHTYWQMAR